MVANAEHMKVGHWYVFRHKRKGNFFGRYMGSEMTPEDIADPMLLLVDIWTQDGSAQERLANAVSHENGVKQFPAFTPKKLRPSLIESIDTPNTVTQDRLNSLDFSPIKGGDAPSAPTPIEIALEPEPSKRFGIFRRKK